MRGKTKSDEYLFHPPQPVRAAFWATECVLVSKVNCCELEESRNTSEGLMSQLTRKTRAAVIGPGYGP